MDLKVIGFEDVPWVHMAQHGFQWEAVLNTAMNLWIL
jgi:hypothetical protein